jgi:hypothetical protein
MCILIPIADLAVTDSSPGGGELDVPSFQDFDVVHAVLADQIVSPVGGTRRKDPMRLLTVWSLPGPYR